jgi:hypothetical protein
MRTEAAPLGALGQRRGRQRGGAAQVQEEQPGSPEGGGGGERDGTPID